MPNADAGVAQLRQDAAYWRAEYEHLEQLLANMTDDQRTLIAHYSPNAVRRLHVDHETALDLALEAERALARLEDLDVDQVHVDVDEGPGLF